MRQVEFDFAFIFKYSERKNTLAYRKFPDDIPDSVKTDRLMRLNERQIAISLKRNQALIGQSHEVLIENETTPKSAEECSGRNDGNKIVNLPRNGYKLGDVVRVRITGASVNSIKAQPCQG